MTGILSGLGCVLAPDGMGFGVGFDQPFGCVPRNEYFSSSNFAKQAAV